MILVDSSVWIDYFREAQTSQNFRALRAQGITVRKTIDLVIAPRCIEDGLTLLHSDRDFIPFHTQLGLRVAYSET